MKKFRPEKAMRLQQLLSKKVICTDTLPESIRYVAGVDVAYAGESSIGAVSVLNYDSLEATETKTSSQPTLFPYIPNFLAYREIPPALSAIRKLKVEPDLYLVDGHGLAHPRRFGLATHLGLILDAPAIGVAKNILCGKVQCKGSEPWKPIIHEDKTLGAAVHTRKSVKPVYVSIGHKISLRTAVEVVLSCTKRYRIPEPLRLAHRAAEEVKPRSLA